MNLLSLALMIGMVPLFILAIAVVVRPEGQPVAIAHQSGKRRDARMAR